MKLSLYEYNQLDEMEQTEALWEYGVMIGDRIEGNFKYVLYSMFDFYIELKYNHIHNAINGSRAFKSVSQLEPYLDKIDISGLKP